MKKVFKVILCVIGTMACLVLWTGMVLMVKKIMALYDGHPAGTTFYVREDRDWKDGRTLEIYHQDSALMVFPRHEFLHATVGNLYLPDSMEAEADPFLRRVGACAVAVHRFHGRVDTLYTEFRGYLEVGYVSRKKKTGDWIVVECKVPGEIMGNRCRTVAEGDSPALENYTYEGQAAIFDSDTVHYWIASRRTPDLYGPLTERELATQAEQLGIALPIKLRGLHDRYVLNRSGNEVPKAFSWPDYNKRPDKVVGK